MITRFLLLYSKSQNQKIKRREREQRPPLKHTYLRLTTKDLRNKKPIIFSAQDNLHAVIFSFIKNIQRINSNYKKGSLTAL